MLKWVQCIRRRWLEYGEELVSLGAELSAFRVEVSAALAVEANARWQEARGSAAPFDGLAEVHFSGSAPEFLAALEQAGPRERVEKLLALQEDFADVPHSCFFLASQDVEASFSLGDA